MIRLKDFIVPIGCEVEIIDYHTGYMYFKDYGFRYNPDHEKTKDYFVCCALNRQAMDQKQGYISYFPILKIFISELEDKR